MTTILINASGGNWSAGGTWVGGVAPTAADDVVYDALTGTLTIDGTSGSPNLCRSFTATVCTGTLTHGSAKQLNIGDGTTGHFKIVSGLTYAPSAGSLIKFISTSGGVCQITTNAKRVGPFTFDGVGGSWQFQDAVNPVAASTITLTNGALDTNGQAVGATSGVIFSSTNSNTRSLTMGATTWTMPNSTATTWNISTSTGMTLSAASSTINSLITSGTQTFAGGGLTYGTLTITSLTTGIFYITGSNTLGTLTLSCGGSGMVSSTGFMFGGNQTVTGTLTGNGTTIIRRNFFYSDTMGTPRTITAATVSFTNADFRDIVGAGAANWNLSGITGGSGDCGGNSGITFNTPKNCYLKTNTFVNFSDSTVWFTASGGSTQIVPSLPMVQDSCFIDGNSTLAAPHTYKSNLCRSPGLDFTGVPLISGFVAVAGVGVDIEYYGGITVVANCGSITGGNSGAITFCGRSNYTLASAGFTWPGVFNAITINAPGGSITQLDDFATINSGQLFVTSGTWDDGGFTTTITGGATTINGGTLTITNTFNLVNLIFSSGVINLGAQMNGSSTIILSGGTTNDTSLTGEYKGTTFSCTGGTHTIRKLTLSSTFSQSSSSSITIPVGGNATWATSWTWTGILYTFITNGPATWTLGTLLVKSSGGNYTFC